MNILIFLMILSFGLYASDDYNVTQVAQNLGLSISDYNFLMGLSGLFIGFVILFFAIYFLKD